MRLIHNLKIFQEMLSCFSSFVPQFFNILRDLVHFSTCQHYHTDNVAQSVPLKNRNTACI